jgi:hypothetical protein
MNPLDYALTCLKNRALWPNISGNSGKIKGFRAGSFRRSLGLLNLRPSSGKVEGCPDTGNKSGRSRELFHEWRGFEKSGLQEKVLRKPAADNTYKSWLGAIFKD